MSRHEPVLGWYLCPECSARLEELAGPDGLHNCECPACDWWRCFDPAADEFASRELHRVPVDERGEWAEP